MDCLASWYSISGVNKHFAVNPSYPIESKVVHDVLWGYCRNTLMKDVPVDMNATDYDRHLYQGAGLISLNPSTLFDCTGAICDIRDKKTLIDFTTDLGRPPKAITKVDDLEIVKVDTLFCHLGDNDGDLHFYFDKYGRLVKIKCMTSKGDENKACRSWHIDLKVNKEDPEEDESVFYAYELDNLIWVDGDTYIYHNGEYDFMFNGKPYPPAAVLGKLKRIFPGKTASQLNSLYNRLKDNTAYHKEYKIPEVSSDDLNNRAKWKVYPLNMYAEDGTRLAFSWQDGGKFVPMTKEMLMLKMPEWERKKRKTFRG